mmetsp:Transcript_199/g.668  ORF Transcript_199/g.668 Transcript_199/m.668 type:complete len:224 (-) Transcript_199:491-1162(-)
MAPPPVGSASRSSRRAEVSASCAFICAVGICSSSSSSIFRLLLRRAAGLRALSAGASEPRAFGPCDERTDERRARSKSSTTAPPRPGRGSSSSSKRGGSKSRAGSGSGASCERSPSPPLVPTSAPPIGDTPSVADRIRSTSISSSSSSPPAERRRRFGSCSSRGASKAAMSWLYPNPASSASPAPAPNPSSPKPARPPSPPSPSSVASPPRPRPASAASVTSP